MFCGTYVDSDAGQLATTFIAPSRPMPCSSMSRELLPTQTGWHPVSGAHPPVAVSQYCTATGSMAMLTRCVWPGCSDTLR